MLKELLRQETEIKDQISHWGPVVEQLARLSGETIDSDMASRINELKQDQGSDSARLPKLPKSGNCQNLKPEESPASP